MAKKQTPVTETAVAAPRRTAKPRAPRVTASTHSKTVSGEATPPAPAAAVQNPTEAIARLAYSYWEARGFQAGCTTEDWLRAEREYSRK